MEKVKVFETNWKENPNIQRDVNKWLKEKGDSIEITRVLQSAVGEAELTTYGIIITIFYKDKK